MGRKEIIVMPQTQKLLSNLGERIKLARLRRKLSIMLVSQRAGISRATLWKIENGDSSVSIGAYAAVLNAIGMAGELENVIREDILGRTLQDLDLPLRKRAPRRSSGAGR